MIVKTIVLNIHILESHSLKDKRKFIKSIIKRIHQKFNVYISEIGRMNEANYSLLGIAIITNSNSFADKILDKCMNLIESDYPIDIISVERERF